MIFCLLVFITGRVAEVVAQKADGNLELLDLEVRRQLSI
jgi:hypothetical protein